MAQALWIILLKSMQDDNLGGGLTCSECFRILEYLTDMALIGVNITTVKAATHKHLSNCPDFREYYLQRLEEIEALALAEKTVVGSSD